LPNIVNATGQFNSNFTVYTPNPLVFRNGTVLPGSITYVPAGTSSSTPSATLLGGLAANAGSWDFKLPPSTQSPTGLLQPFQATPKTQSIYATISRQMLPNLNVFAEFLFSENRSESVSNPYSGALYIPASVPTNPFNSAVFLSFPSALNAPFTTESTSQSFTVGAIAKLPFTWTGEIDFNSSENRFKYFYDNYDATAQANDLQSGAFNPFVDTLLHPLNLSKYLSPTQLHSSTVLDDLALRALGPLWTLPWGTPDLAVGLEHRVGDTKRMADDLNFPITTSADEHLTYFARRQVTDSAYGEVQVPLVKADWLPLLHSLDLQLSGREERYTVDAGTPYYIQFPNNPASNSYGAPTLNGQPYSSKATYTSNNGTLGLKYQPVSQLTLRASRATAFLPPTPDQLVKNPVVDPSTTTVIDPKSGQVVSVHTLSGGNPNLTPQNSKSWNVGLIWEPDWQSLKGLRFDAEHYKIEQFDAITILDPQTIVNLESTYPARVTRNSSGQITVVDTSSLNLFKRDTEGWDLGLDYSRDTQAGIFRVHAAESIISHLKQQIGLTLPDLEYVNFPAEGGAAKYKANATLSWAWRGWTTSWTARYYGAYKQFGAAGGPDSVQFFKGANATSSPFSPSYLQAQGSDTIPSQTYHDVFVGYAFGALSHDGVQSPSAAGARLLDGMSMQVGIRNVFNKLPPFDVFYTYYVSPYGDPRLRNFSIIVRKRF
jgi:outer membrane receptor protein involved in Fe transport